ncbi:MAG: AAA family ATPase [Myxococcota bacterium]
MTEQIAEAYHLMEHSSENLFLTGRAGTGKSTLLKYFIENTKKNVVVLAPTGVAALNVGGQTIHSFFRFKIDITLDKIERIPKYAQKLYKSIDTIVIDEISMVRADLFDCIDKFLRLNGKKKNMPFGGAQIILIGDIYQLPPVVKGVEKEIFRELYKSQYFFDSNAFRNSDFRYIELEKIFRQKDQNFIDILNAIRKNRITDEQLMLLNSRVDEDFIPSERDMYIQLTTTNDIADKINNTELSRIDSELHTFIGNITGEFDEKLLPTDIELNLKIGAQIMLVNNDPDGRWVNGTLGRVIGFDELADEELIIVELENRDIVEVTSYTWKIIRYNYDRERKRIITEQIGSFSQFPILLAWAITIHKSQGKTFEKAIIDIGQRTFAHGQLYVALSRCKSLSGIILRRPIEKRHIIMDRRVVDFVTSFQYKEAERILPECEKIKILENAIEKNENVVITYLKKTDEKSVREIRPIAIGEMEFNKIKFIGLRAIDIQKGEERHFRIDRILFIEEEKE